MRAGLWLCTSAAAILLLGCASIDDGTRRRAATHRELAQLKMQQGELAIAIREYRRSLDLLPKDPETHFGISEAYRRKALYTLAEKHLRRVLRLDPDHQDARLNLGVVYLQQERWSDAIAQATILVKDPTFIRPGRALVNRGWAHYKSGQLVEAERDFVQALDEGGAAEAARMNLGIVYYDQGEVVQAVQQFKKVIELLEHRPPQIFGSGVAEARFRLARAYVELGHRQEAIRHLELAEKRGGRDEWGRKSKEYLSVLR